MPIATIFLPGFDDGTGPGAGLRQPFRIVQACPISGNEAVFSSVIVLQ
jgi:hypothetical protein